ncbi:MAG: hypothetical protein H6766_07850 [Candidatus Peribacteria bacterium]|nr:MAG: hypothetical protein H6766_07850 [Candidatus Peribacteria bacterium]
MSSQYKEMITPNDMISLPRFKAYTKLMVDGITTDPFSMQTLPLVSPEDSVEIKDKIRRQSRQRYAMERGRLEGLLQAWASKSFSKQEAIARQAQLE